jgi:hypothetical protein
MTNNDVLKKISQYLAPPEPSANMKGILALREQSSEIEVTEEDSKELSFGLPDDAEAIDEPNRADAEVEEAKQGVDSATVGAEIVQPDIKVAEMESEIKRDDIDEPEKQLSEVKEAAKEVAMSGEMIAESAKEIVSEASLAHASYCPETAVLPCTPLVLSVDVIGELGAVIPPNDRPFVWLFFFFISLCLSFCL